jgi:hypothetical protein
MVWDYLIYTVLAVLVALVAYDWLRGVAFAEGFTDGVVPEFFGRYFPRRYDIVPGQTEESDGWLRNPRYFEGYVDLQRLGYAGDFCRVVEKDGVPDSRIMACALAGQEGLDSLTYRTESARSGMRFSRDDYFRDVNDDGRADYGRILKLGTDRWETRVVPAGLTRFKQGVELPDPSPPAHIQDLLWFYEGIMVWYRWFDDMLDYAENTQLKVAGDARVDETLRKTVTEGLPLNRLAAGADDESAQATPEAADQFLKVGENAHMEFDSLVQIRQLRAISVWAYFDAFTYNARIFDFGNGAGRDNVFLGIDGRGSTLPGGAAGVAPPNLVCNTKPAPEVSPQTYLATSDANIDEWTCPGPEPVPTTFDPATAAPQEAGEPAADLLFEIWDAQQRKMRIKVHRAVPLKRWVHIALTTTDGTSLRPTWAVYIDGAKVHEEYDGFMPMKSYMSNNYIGRSNWETVSAGYSDPDERFRGALFDFRLYKQPMSSAKIARTVQWGRERLGAVSRP